jgi:hypothetical protein
MPRRPSKMAVMIWPKVANCRLTWRRATWALITEATLKEESLKALLVLLVWLARKAWAKEGPSEAKHLDRETRRRNCP